MKKQSKKQPGKRSSVFAPGLAALCVLALGIVFAGCGGGSSTGLVYWTMWNEAEPQGQVISRAVAAFTEETGIRVEVNYNGREIRKTLQPALDAGEVVDLFDEDIERVSNTWGNYLLPLDEYVTRAYPTTGGRPYQEVVNSTLLDLARQLGNGSIRNIPYQPSAFVTMYNKDLFAQAGIAAPPKNWTEFLDACARLKAIGVAGITVDDAYMACLFGYTIDRLVGMDATLAMVANNDFSGPQVLEFGRIWQNMARNGYISPNAASNIYPAGQVQEIAAGRVAMYLNGTWLPNEIKGNAPDMNWGAFAWPAINPGGDGITANNYGAQSFGINKNSKYPDEAFRLIVWLTTGPWDVTLAEESLGIPMANDSEWPQALREAKAVVEATTKRLPWAVGMEDNPDINAKIKENFARLVKGDLTAEQFAEAMRR
ncbi:MAG: extracellular solute-binding protein [Spirochaetaceae bacterium]|jgi:raffinose/stachyose/melibiose transport system substrate-binding protein|nr:extracellular solute-binding protein [Spirochaetaceae bacterium]